MSEANELADHKQRLGTMSARLAAAESELRRLRRVIDDAPELWKVFNEAGDVLGYREVVSATDADNPSRAECCKVLTMDVLEAIDVM